MNKDELLKKWQELTSTWTSKEAKLEVFIQKWIDDESSYTVEFMEQFIDNTNKQIQELKSMADEVINEYNRIAQEEMLKAEDLISAKRNVKKEFGVSPDEIIITGGLLSSNANDSHLIGRDKTEEELEQERQIALAEIRNRVANKQISLAEASKLKNDIKLAYGNKEDSNGMHR